MKLKLFPFLCVLAAVATSTYSQTNNFTIPVALHVVADNNGGGEISRPRIVEDKAAGVKASVIVNVASVERIAFRMLNEKRAEKGLRPLMWSDDLERVAHIHSQNMADLSFFSHQGIDGKMVSDRADCLGVGNWRSIGENIAFTRGFSDPIARAVDLWMDSPSHRHNLLDDNWKESAVGVAVAADGSYYFTQVFLLRK